jgi:hypothetical protein
MQAWFILDPAKTLEESSRELQSLLTQTLATRLPEGVAHLYLSTEQAPSFAEILHNASHIRFYGPEGAELLQHIVHQAATRQPGSSVNVMMVVPRDPDFLHRSVNPRWTAGSLLTGMIGAVTWTVFREGVRETVDWYRGQLMRDTK